MKFLKNTVYVFLVALLLCSLLVAQESAGSDAILPSKTSTIAPVDQIDVIGLPEVEQSMVSDQSLVAENETSDIRADIDAVSGADDVSDLSGVSEVPGAKRPKKADREALDKLEPLSDEDREKNEKILKYGLESDIMDLVDKLIANKDVRYADKAYDLFGESKNIAVKEKILQYFTKIEDPCLEDFAVTIINDPYDEKLSTVNSCFAYIQAVKTTCAVPALVTLLESDNAEYFNGALESLGKIGGQKEAVYLSEYLDREDLTLQQKQSLVRVLGQLKADKTYDKLVEIAKDNDENSFMRMYACEAIGQMGKHEAMFILSDLYSDTDPNVRAYVIKGIANYLEDEAFKTIIQAVRDSHYKVRLEAIEAVKKLDIKDASPYLVYRAQNDSEDQVKNACYKTLAFLNTSDGNEYLTGQIKDKKVSDATKLKISRVLLENMDNGVGVSDIVDLAKSTITDDRRKDLRYKLGKEISKYKNELFAPLCKEYMASKDVATQGTGLDMYAKGRYLSCKSDVEALAALAVSEDEENSAKKVKKNVNAEKAKKILETKVES